MASFHGGTGRLTSNTIASPAGRMTKECRTLKVALRSDHCFVITPSTAHPVKHVPSTLLLLIASATAADLPLPAKIEFNRDVRPILSETCFKCHGFDKKHREGKRRLDTREGALETIEDVRAVVPGKLDESELHVRIHSTDKDEQMPPPDSGKKVTVRQIAILDKWIEQGAEYQPHWAYAPLVRPAVPAVKEPDFVGNPIDEFVLARQRELGLRHAAAADARTLCRRLFFDLTGVPPTPGDVEAFAQSAIRNRQSAISVRGHTDLCLGDLKFSGNSQRRRKNFLLYHGTLLLDCNLNLISELLRMPSLEPHYRASRPHEAFVTNLNLPAAKVKLALAKEWNAVENLNNPRVDEIKKLAREKYSANEWNFKF